MKLEVWDEKEKPETKHRLRLFRNEGKGGIEIITVDANGVPNPYGLIGIIKDNGFLILSPSLRSQGFRTDERGQIIVQDDESRVLNYGRSD